MAEWKVIKDEPVVDSRGLPVKRPRLDADYEPIFHEMGCPGSTPEAKCAERFTNITLLQEHMAEQHPDAGADWSVNSTPVTEQADVIRLVVELLTALQAGGGSPFVKVRKPQTDARHMDEVWRRIGAARTNKAPLRLRDDQYVWLRQALDRPIPQAGKPGERDAAEEKQTVGSLLFGGLEATVKWYLTNLPERGQRYEDPPEDEAKPALPPAAEGAAQSAAPANEE